MGGVLVHNHDTGLGLGDDVGRVKLRSGGTERVDLPRLLIDRLALRVLEAEHEGASTSSPNLGSAAAGTDSREAGNATRWGLIRHTRLGKPARQDRAATRPVSARERVDGSLPGQIARRAAKRPQSRIRYGGGEMSRRARAAFSAPTISPRTTPTSRNRTSVCRMHIHIDHLRRKIEKEGEHRAGPSARNRRRHCTAP